ncbi:hypothetical protein HK104_006942 [Borealophlyctis nickersoniae]|nr:hypothetical protein HK104_006942 [Borealophlyctis nickersoniae]
MPKPTDASEPPAPEKRPSSDGQPLSRPAVAPIKTAAANGGTIPRPTATPVIEVRPPSWHGGPPSQYPFLDEVRAAAEGRPREPDTPVRRRRSLLRSKASPDLTGDTGLLGVIKNQLSNSDLKGAAAAAAAAEQVDTDRESVESVEPVTGLAYASEADNNYFHRTFPAIPDDDRLINDYVCAINNTAGVLIQGRIYISQHHFAFKGWTGNAIWKRFTEVKHIEKKNVALVIPNAIEIETDERTFFFASFLQRDDAFDLLCKLWDSHVSIHSLFRKFPEPYDPHCTCEGLGTCESCYKLATRMKDLEPQKADEEQRGRPFLRQLTKSRVALRSLIGGEGNASDSETPPIRERSRDGKKRASNTSTGDGGPSPAKTSSSTGITAADESRGSETSDPVEPAEEGKLGSESATPQVPDRKGRPAAQCGCADRHAKMTTILDKEYPVPIETLWKMMYTLEAGGKGWLAKFLTERKLRDIMVGPWTEDSDVELQPIAQAGGGKAFAPDLGDVKVGQYRRLEYIMPLVQPLGPKQTTCILRDEVVDKNEE